MLTYYLSTYKNLPLYEALYDCIRQDILNGTLSEGERLPSKRALAKHLNISITTVEHAYQKLEEEAYLVSRPGCGFFVEKRSALLGSNGLQLSASNTDVLADVDRGGFERADSVPLSASVSREEKAYQVELTENHSSLSLFPSGIWVRLIRQILSESTSESSELFHSVPYNGLYSLREAIAGYLRKYRGFTVSPDQIIIGAGTEYLYQRLIQLLGVGAIIAFADPGYKALARGCMTSGHLVQFIPMGSEGLDIRALRRSIANVVHLSPANHFPTGAIMSLEQRADILEWAGEASFRYIIEDDYDCEFSSRGGDIMPLFAMDRNERVIYMNTFSKTLVPSIRISYMVLPKTLLPLYENSLSFYSCTASGFEQQALTRFISEGHLERHVDKLKNHYDRKCRRFVEALESSGLSPIVTIPNRGAGTHLLIRVRTSMTDQEIRSEAERQGVHISLLSDYCHRPRPYDLQTLVINVAALQDEQEGIASAIGALERLFLDEHN